MTTIEERKKQELIDVRCKIKNLEKQLKEDNMHAYYFMKIAYLLQKEMKLTLYLMGVKDAEKYNKLGQ